jgi:hypothetical protein
MAIASHTATLGLMHPLGTARTRKLQISRSKAEAFVPAGDSTYAPEGTYSPIRKVGYFDCTVDVFSLALQKTMTTLDKPKSHTMADIQRQMLRTYSDDHHTMTIEKGPRSAKGLRPMRTAIISPTALNHRIVVDEQAIIGWQ